MRAAALARRSALTEEQRSEAGEAIADALRQVLSTSTRVAAYLAVGTEPPTAPALLLCRETIVPVLLPDNDLDWAPGRHGEPTARGLLEPTGPRLGVDAISTSDVVLVPALAVDGAGNRLGRGGGSYDRALRRSTGLTVAVVYDEERVASVPVEPHDTPVRAWVSPSGLVQLR